MASLSFFSLLLVLSLSVCSSSQKTQYLLRNFSPAAGLLDSSYYVSGAPDTSFCSVLCSQDSQCLSTIYDELNLRCYRYDHVSILRQSAEDSSYRLLQVKCSTTPPTTEDCCYHDSATCGTPRYIDCHDAFLQGDRRQNEVYYLKPSESWGKVIKARCQFDSTGGWTLLQNRLDGSVDFYRDWASYTAGFGFVHGEYWIGLEALYYLTLTNRKMGIYLEAWDGQFRTANYSTFYIDDSSLKFQLHISGYSGDAGDSLALHNGAAFSTYDNENDWSGENCAVSYTGAYWYHACHSSNLNGKYFQGGTNSEINKGAVWSHWKGASYSYKKIYIRVSR